MEISDSIRLLIALVAVCACIIVALLTFVVVRLEQRHRREEDAEARRVTMWTKLLGRREARESFARASDAADEVLRR